jgi:hypothetical protein
VPLEPLQLAIALLCCAVGATVQAAAGFGLALIAAPILVLLEPAFVPGPLTAASLVLTVLVAARDHAAMDLHGIGWAMVGRVFGTAAAAGFLALATPRVFDLVFGLLVLAGVGLSLAGFHAPPARGSAIVAGGLSGLMGTISAIGGPPMALLYQRSGAARLRGTLAFVRWSSACRPSRPSQSCGGRSADARDAPPGHGTNLGEAGKTGSADGAAPDLQDSLDGSALGCPVRFRVRRNDLMSDLLSSATLLSDRVGPELVLSTHKDIVSTVGN